MFLVLKACKPIPCTKFGKNRHQLEVYSFLYHRCTAFVVYVGHTLLVPQFVVQFFVCFCYIIHQSSLITIKQLYMNGFQRIRMDSNHILQWGLVLPTFTVYKFIYNIKKKCQFHVIAHTVYTSTLEDQKKDEYNGEASSL